jgi:hypothetical protein
MRRLAPLLLLAPIGCTDGLAPPFLSTDLAAMPAAEDMAVADALEPDLLGESEMGTQCSTACDCTPGQSCQPNGLCTNFSAPQVFCCGAATCSGSSFCQAPSGGFSQCNAPADAGTVVATDGGAATCPSRACTPGAAGDQLCELACGRNNATCAGAPPHCMP